MPDLVYDIEVYPNVFTITFLDPETNNHITYEMSDWKDDWVRFVEFTQKCSNKFIRWVGFNNFYYDYQVLHKLLNHAPFADMKDKAGFAYQVSDKLINLNRDEKFHHIIWQNNHIVPQVDLFRIHHFDNLARATSLKKLEFNMRSKSIQDLPYKPGTILTEYQKDKLIRYNLHDVRETNKFREKSVDMIRFRDELSKKYDKDFTNHNDTKIGKDYFIMELQNAGIECFRIKDGQRVPVQTKRPVIRLNEVIFPYIKFNRPEFNAVLSWIRKQNITQTKGVFTEIDDLGELEKYANLKLVKKKVKNLNCIVDGFQFDFGTGGIHGSVESTVVEEDDNFAIIDYDVTSLYPSIAIVNRIFPQHLTHKFCDVYATLKQDRLSYAKGTPENAMLKLALNGVYGDSNNPYSPFYDPKYTMAITINGQLMLAMLAEKMMEISSVRLLQINTDGLTIKVARKDIDAIEEINTQWQKLTGLELERADYSKMFIRDVNNYQGLYTNGKVKRKGAYEYEMGWHQDQSALVVQKAVEAHLLYGKDIAEFIKNHEDQFDFMLRTNVPRSSRLMWEKVEAKQLQNVTRYYISNYGGALVKIMPPLKGKENERRININGGFLATEVNNINSDGDEIFDINYDWYIAEAKKLTDPLWAGAVKELLT